uniref:histone deacetylase n=1 Tax=Hydra vulgaris TaxID=6087 RepID=T2MF04_HYDVU
MAGSELTSSNGDKKTSEKINSFAEQLLLLRRQQDEQYRHLTLLYKAQQDSLRQQQEHELSQHYKRQTSLHPTTKNVASYMSTSSKPYDYQHTENTSSLVERRIEEAKPQGNAISEDVRNKIRERVFRNIKKRNSKPDPRLSGQCKEDFITWSYKPQAYIESYAPDNDGLFDLPPLRKAASEPNLKRTPLYPYPKSRGRNKLYSATGESRYLSALDDQKEKRDDTSPLYLNSTEGNVFYEGSQKNNLLFQSPSLPNINIESTNTKLYFPIHMSTLEHPPTDSTSDLKAPLQPDHPKYLDMLKTQYATNHRYLQHIIQERNLEPKEIDNLHLRYLPKSDNTTLSDVQRVKQLLESQNKLYLHLTEPLGINSSYFERSKNVSKSRIINDSSSLSSPFHSQYYDMKTSSPTLDQHSLDSHQHSNAHIRLPFLSNQDSFSSLHNASQPTRMRLKEHLREKLDATSSKSMSLDAHFHRLEKDNQIQEETEEDVAKEEKVRSQVSSSLTDGSSLTNPSNGYSPGCLYGSNPQLSESYSGIYGSKLKFRDFDSSLHGSDSRLYDSQLQTKKSETDDKLSLNLFKHPKEMTGLVYDPIMLKHQCTCGESYPKHPESAGRLQSIWARLQETGVANMCELIRPRKATIAELQTVHSEKHTLLYGSGTRKEGTQNLRCFTTLSCGGVGVDAVTVWNDTHTSNAARMAAGCVIELAFKVASNELKNGFAIVRPPGHHAETHQAMGYCYFNSVAIAAKLLCLKMAAERVLIFDWDIHHGNGTQQMFYDDDRVLYISIHRHDEGSFFPGTGKAEECGAGIGVGCNINIPFDGGLDLEYGDKEYLAAFQTVVLPVVKEYQPDIILISAGFNAAGGHSDALGGYNVSSACFSYMTKELMQFANGKVVLVLEGGYILQTLCDASESCIRALLGCSTNELSEKVLKGKPNDNAIKCLEKVVELQGRYWPGIKHVASNINSHFYGIKTEKEDVDAVSALASLSMQVTQSTSVEKVPNLSNKKEEPMDES